MHNFDANVDVHLLPSKSVEEISVRYCLRSAKLGNMDDVDELEQLTVQQSHTSHETIVKVFLSRATIAVCITELKKDSFLSFLSGRPRTWRCESIHTCMFHDTVEHYESLREHRENRRNHHRFDAQREFSATQQDRCCPTSTGAPDTCLTVRVCGGSWWVTRVGQRTTHVCVRSEARCRRFFRGGSMKWAHKDLGRVAGEESQVFRLLRTRSFFGIASLIKSFSNEGKE